MTPEAELKAAREENEGLKQLLIEVANYLTRRSLGFGLVEKITAALNGDGQ